MLVHYHFHCKTANLQHKCSFIITFHCKTANVTQLTTQNAHSLSLSIVRLLNLHSWQTQMLIHYHFHCKTANLHSWQHKCSFIITSIVRQLTTKWSFIITSIVRTANLHSWQKQNAHSLSLPLERLLSYTADNTNARSLSLPFVRLLNLHSWQHKCSLIITWIVRLLTYTADNTNARSLSQHKLLVHFHCKTANLLLTDTTDNTNARSLFTSIVRLLNLHSWQTQMPRSLSLPLEDC